jgi:hypothetical protein
MAANIKNQDVEDDPDALFEFHIDGAKALIVQMQADFEAEQKVRLDRYASLIDLLKKLKAGDESALHLPLSDKERAGFMLVRQSLSDIVGEMSINDGSFVQEFVLLLERIFGK